MAGAALGAGVLLGRETAPSNQAQTPTTTRPANVRSGQATDPATQVQLAAMVFGALVDLANYPAWWPDIRAVSRVDDNTAELTCRALLPYALVFRLHRAEQDERSGRLRVDLTGAWRAASGAI